MLYHVRIFGTDTRIRMEAPSEEAAAEMVRRLGHTVIEVEADVLEAGGDELVSELHGSGAVHDAEVVGLLRQIHEATVRNGEAIRQHGAGSLWLANRRKFAQTIGFNVLVAVALGLLLAFVISGCFGGIVVQVVGRGVGRLGY